jgi:hypothetical protein
MMSKNLIRFLYNRQAHFAMDNRFYAETNRGDSSSEESIVSGDMLLFSNCFHPVPDHLLHFPYTDRSHNINNDILQVPNRTDGGAGTGGIWNHARQTRHTSSFPPDYDTRRFTNDDTYFSLPRDIRDESIHTNNAELSGFSSG